MIWLKLPVEGNTDSDVDALTSRRLLDIFMKRHMKFAAFPARTFIGSPGGRALMIISTSTTPNYHSNLTVFFYYVNFT